MKNIIYVFIFLFITSCKSSYISPSNYEYYEHYDKNNANYYMLMVDEKNDKIHFLFANKNLPNPYDILWFSGGDRDRIEGSINMRVNNMITIISDHFKWCQPSPEEITKLVFYARSKKNMMFLNALEDIIDFPCRVRHFQDIPILPIIDVMKRTKGIDYKKINEQYRPIVELLIQGKIYEAQEKTKNVDIKKLIGK